MLVPREVTGVVDQVHLGSAPTYSHLIFALSLSMLAYTGIETVSNMAEEAKDPGHDIPKAVNLVLLILALAAAGLGGLPVSVLTASDVTAFLAGMACIHAPGTPAASSLLICWLLARRLGRLKVVPSSPATPYSQYLARRLDR